MFPSLPKWWLCAWIKHTLTYKGVSDQVDFFKYKTVCPSVYRNTFISVQIHFPSSSSRSCVLKIALFICSSQNTTKITPLSWDCGEMCSALSAEHFFHHRAPQINLTCVWSTVQDLGFKTVPVKNILKKCKELRSNYFGFSDNNTTAVLSPKRSKLT